MKHIKLALIGLVCLSMICLIVGVKPGQAFAVGSLYDVKLDYGAVGDGVTNDRTAIQNAINAAQVNGGIVYFPAGNYLLDGTGTELLLITGQIHLLGAGARSKLVVASTVSSTTDVIRIKPTTFAGFGYGIDSIYIAPQSGTPARHALNIDITNADQIMAKLYIQNSNFYQFGGRAIYLTNPTNLDGFFTSIIQNNLFYGGLSLQNAGDSLNFIGNTFTGTNAALDLSLVSGAAQVVIAFNNITSAGGAVRVTGGSQIKILHNQIEQVVAHTGPDNAMISIEGLPTNYVQFVEITGNNMNAHTFVANNIRLNYSAYAQIRNNVLTKEGAGPFNNYINILSNAVSTGIDADNYFGTPTGTVSYSTAITDNGSYTNGVKKSATLLNSWVNYDTANWESASFMKDSDGFVHLSGLIKNGTTTPGTVIFTLPANFRPKLAHKFSVVSNNGSTSVLGDVNVLATGEVMLISGSNGYLSLDGISFSIN